MKGSFFGLRCKELSLILIVLVCSTILIWTWDRTPLLTSFLPPKSRLLQLSPEIQVGAPLAPSVSSEPQIRVSKEISAFTEKETENDQEQNKDVLVSVTDEEANQKQIPEAEQNGNAESSTSTTEVEGEKLILGGKDSKQEEQSMDTVVPTGSTNTSPSVRGENDRNMTTRMENKDVLLSVTEEEANHKQIQQAEENGNAESSTSTTEVEGEKLILGGKDSKQEEQSIDTIVPTGSTYTGSSVRGENDRNMTTRMENQACNYAKGKWVVDENRSLYSGFGCKQWLSQMWACRLMQRKDFAYEKLRWQPKDCQMEEFEQSKFFKRMQDKTLAFVGDSLGRQQFQSLMCMITGGEERHDVINVGKEYGLVKPRGAIRPSGWAYLFPSTNTTVLYYWSASLCDLEPLNVTNPATDYAMHLDRPPAFLRRFLHKFDVLVLNTGHHWNRGKLRANRWVMYVGGVRNTNMKIAQIGGAKNLTVHSIVNWVNSQLPKHPRLKAFYRSISPRHFVNGDWNTGGSCDNTTPMSIGKEVLQDKSSDYSAASAVKGTGVKLLDITAVSQMRDEGHISRYSLTASKGVQDCLHWCLPGVPDTWNEILFAQI